MYYSERLIDPFPMSVVRNKVMENAYSLQQYIDDLRSITGATSDEDGIISRVGPLAQRLAADKSWLLPEYYASDEEQGFGVKLLHEEPDHTLVVLMVNWLPGRGTPPHDHGTWAVVAGVEGTERNIRYKRVDDGSRTGYAELEVKNELDAGEGDLVCMKTGGIHAVTNQTETMTLSLHTYGKHINYTDRSQYDLDTNEKKDYIVRMD
jgi:predicted metal-dependent enzyme (double-stranded beta helix superfamily)